MTRSVYVNGRYVPYADAHVSVEDRGFQFADSVYEVIEVRGGRLVDATRHVARLARSLSELAIPRPMADRGLLLMIGEVVRRNRVRDGVVYLQVSRGAGPRDFALPGADRPPTIVCIARALNPALTAAKAATGIAVKSMRDPRWERCDLKTVMLLPSVLAKAAARADGATEAWFVDAGGFVTEGASSNAWIVTASGELVTRQTGPQILAGVTRATMMEVAKEMQLTVRERAFTIAEAHAAREAFITSATTIVMPVVRIDGHTVGFGKPGPVAERLRAAFHRSAEVVAV